MKIKKCTSRALSAVALCVLTLPLAAQDLPEVSHDGLHLRPDSKVAAAYVKPDADFSGYERILIVDAYVAFKKGWELNQRRSSTGRVTAKDMERMKRDLAKLFRKVFVEELDEKGGYEVVDRPELDVLLLRPAIIDLDVIAPDVATTSRSYSIAASAGAATLLLEVYDSVSGEILARVLDRKTANNAGNFMRWTNKATNTAAASRILAEWASLLRESLDEVHGRE